MLRRFRHLAALSAIALCACSNGTSSDGDTPDDDAGSDPAANDTDADPGNNYGGGSTPKDAGNPDTASNDASLDGTIDDADPDAATSPPEASAPDVFYFDVAAPDGGPSGGPVACCFGGFAYDCPTGTTCSTGNTQQCISACNNDPRCIHDCLTPAPGCTHDHARDGTCQ